jgi:hypothetical protein
MPGVTGRRSVKEGFRACEGGRRRKGKKKRGRSLVGRGERVIRWLELLSRVVMELGESGRPGRRMLSGNG